MNDIEVPNNLDIEMFKYRKHIHLIDQVRRLPNGTKINVSIEYSGIFVALTAEQAVGVLYNQTPKWKLTMYEDDGVLQVFLYVEEGCGVGAYATPPTEDDDGNPL